MLKVVYYAITCAMVLCLFVCFARPAYAYVDPGSSLLLLQGMGSAFLGVMYIARKRVRALLGKKEAESTPSGDAR